MKQNMLNFHLAFSKLENHLLTSLNQNIKSKTKITNRINITWNLTSLNETLYILFVRSLTVILFKISSNECDSKSLFHAFIDI